MPSDVAAQITCGISRAHLAMGRSSVRTALFDQATAAETCRVLAVEEAPTHSHGCIHVASVDRRDYDRTLTQTCPTFAGLVHSQWEDLAMMLSWASLYQLRINKCTPASNAGRTAAVALVANTMTVLVLALVTPLPGQACAAEDWVGKRVVPSVARLSNSIRGQVCRPTRL